jgi:hypothetical protein
MSHRINGLYLCCLLVLSAAACADRTHAPDDGRPAKSRKNSPSASRAPVGESASYGSPVHLADLADRNIAESSGIVASRLNPGLYWTHNDAGDGPFIYAFDRSGASKGVWRVAGADALDWEDIAAGPGPARETSYLYIGDIGDNDQDRKVIIVYRIPEPAVDSAVSASRADPLRTAPAEAIRLEFPDGKHNAEALLIHPRTGDLYIITKTKNAACKVYRATAPFDTSTTVQLGVVGELQLPGESGWMITGADISPDGRRVVLCDNFSAYELTLADVDSGFEHIWRRPLASIELGDRRQGEAVCYRHDGLAILATSEETPTPLIEVLRKE